jgi:hypothetical protein
LPTVVCAAGITVVVTGEPETGETPLAWIAQSLLLIVPLVAVTATVKETVCAVTPAFKSPMFHITEPKERVPPPVTETKLVPAGKVSLMTTPAALPDPVLP